MPHSGNISILWSIPFVLLLLCTALLPLLTKSFWEKFYWAIALALGAVPLIYYLSIAPSASRWLRAMEEYISFIILLGSLYIVSGGIFIRVTRKATPFANCALLLIGAVLANIFGTTGASMLLIRPYLRMNAGHVKPFHIVFFIFIVSNVGGALTPIGDPPLFLGYLQGVPFWWVFEHCRPMWLVTVAILIATFFVIDTIDHRGFARNEPDVDGPTVYVRGVHNFLLIALILFAVFQDGIFQMFEHMHDHGATAPDWLRLMFSREFLMCAAAVISRKTTHNQLYEWNEFAWHAIREVAILFIGIFSTMAPALQWLEANAYRMPLKTPGQYYFACGALSSMLDNAPTYLTFLQTELGSIKPNHLDRAAAALQEMRDRGKLDLPLDLPQDEIAGAISAMVNYHADDVLSGRFSRAELEVAFLLGTPEKNAFIVAISLGAVFFGAMTYIGNGPNLMVKSIADASGIKTPGFIGYVVRFALPILLPTYVLVWWIFLR
jgi:Na+/H+ antiporter NhaD/arsenite permease-like protein